MTQLDSDDRVHHGFTGTQIGWSAKQYGAIGGALWETVTYTKRTHVLHHGDCIGSDANIHELAYGLGFDIVVHPPLDPSKRAFVHNTQFWDPERCVLLPGREYLDRNRDIVAASTELIATPKESEEQLRSGTWATVRYAFDKGIPVFFAFRDGTTEWWNSHKAFSTRTRGNPVERKGRVDPGPSKPYLDGVEASP